MLNWKTIYKYWQVHSDWDFENNLARPLIFKNVYVPIDDELSTSFDYSWSSPEKLDEHVSAIVIQIKGGYSHDNHRYKGISYLLELLATATNDEERVALWIYAHSHDLLLREVSASAFQILSEINEASRTFLQDRFVLKYDYAHCFINKLFITSHVLNHAEFLEFEPILHLIMANTALIRKSYIPVFVCTDKNGIPPRFRK